MGGVGNGKAAGKEAGVQEVVLNDAYFQQQLDGAPGSDHIQVNYDLGSKIYLGAYAAGGPNGDLLNRVCSTVRYVFNTTALRFIRLHPKLHFHVSSFPLRLSARCCCPALSDPVAAEHSYFLFFPPAFTGYRRWWEVHHQGVLQGAQAAARRLRAPAGGGCSRRHVQSPGVPRPRGPGSAAPRGAPHELFACSRGGRQHGAGRPGRARCVVHRGGGRL